MPAVLTEREGHLLIVTLNRPERMNAINGDARPMLDAFVEADQDPDIRVIILTGAGGTSARRRPEGTWPAASRATPSPSSTSRPAWPRTPTCTGRRCCAAGGRTSPSSWPPRGPPSPVARSCSAPPRSAWPASRPFGISEVKWSLYPDGGSAVRIPRQIPYTVACELLLTGEHITAQRPSSSGLIGHVVPDGQALAKAKEIGHVIGATGAPLAVKALLRTLRETNGMEESEALRTSSPTAGTYCARGRQEGPGRSRRSASPTSRAVTTATPHGSGN